LTLVRGEVHLLETHHVKDLRVVFGMLGYVLVPTTPAPHVAHVGN
jgi:hypothetical protein